ncbi:hypothetical protein HDV00_009781 [Rhizophlyctis rosea]|nr:hypothetical protein HDV00_009781 [Rhizophlyctis rosea]
MNNLLQTIHSRSFPETTSEDNKRKRQHELKELWDKDLIKHMFDFEAFKSALQDLRKDDGQPYAEGSLKNMFKPLCLVFNHATNEELVQMFLWHKNPTTGKDRMNHAVVSNNSIPIETRVERIKTYLVEPFLQQNKTNRAGVAKRTRQKPLTDEEKDNWVHHRLIQDGFLAALPRLSEILDKANSLNEDIKFLYFWMAIGLSALLLRVPRGDAVHIRHRNYEGTDDPYIADGMLQVVAANKTGRTYVTPLPDQMKPLLKKMIHRSVAKGFDHIFIPQRGKNAMSVSKFNQTYVAHQSLKVFHKHLTTHLIRKSVDTADYQRWKRHNGSINDLF